MKLFFQQLKDKKPSRKTNALETPIKSQTVTQQKSTVPTISFNSTLVRTLRNVLIGNCISLMFVNVSPDADDLESTKLSLDFGQECQGIVTKSR